MLKNVTEILVEDRLDALWKNRTCCKCNKCKNDIMAIALNCLPPHYVCSDEGELFAKVDVLSVTYEFDILRALAMAMKVVEETPRHDKEQE